MKNNIGSKLSKNTICLIFLNKYLKIILFTIFLFPQFLSAQNNMPKEVSSGKNEGIGIKRRRDTLNTYIKSWKLTSYNSFSLQSVDTTMYLFEVSNPMYVNELPGRFVNIGNLGMAANPLSYSTYIKEQRGAYYDDIQTSVFDSKPFYFHQPYIHNILSAKSTKFYHTNKPFTKIFYTKNTKRSEEEQSLRFIHTQNLSRKLNVGVNYKLVSSEGMYALQRTRNNSVRFFSSYLSKRYMMHLSANMSKLKIRENGGLKKDADLTEKPDAMGVRMQRARSTNKNIDIMLVQRYNLGRFIEKLDTSELSDSLVKIHKLIPTDSLGYRYRYKTSTSLVHRIEFNTSQRIFEDENKYETQKVKVDGILRNLMIPYFDKDYYPYMKLTYDSVYCRSLHNSLEWLLPVNSERRIFPGAGLRIVGGNEIYKVYNMKSLLRPQGNDTTYSNFYIGGNIFRKKGLIQLNAEGKLYMLGHRAGNIAMRGEIKNFIPVKNDSILLAVSAKLTKERANYFEEVYYGRNIRWDKKLDERIEMQLRGLLHNPLWSITVGAEYSLIDNHVYLGTESLPKQAGKGISVITAFLNKDIHIKKFHFINKLMWQKTSNEAVFHLPDILFFNSTYFQTNFFNNALLSRFGIDVKFSTEYLAPAYNPAIGMFYLQNEYKTGNHADIDIFANFRIKKVYLYLKYEHLSTIFMDEKYFPVYNYPQNINTFKIGIAWRFFD